MVRIFNVAARKVGDMNVAHHELGAGAGRGLGQVVGKFDADDGLFNVPKGRRRTTRRAPIQLSAGGNEGFLRGR